MPIANVNGVNLNYEVAGQGEAVVFLHGYTGSTPDWSNQISVLSPKYRAVALDCRGHGKSATPSREKDYSVQIFADDVFIPILIPKSTFKTRAGSRAFSLLLTDKTVPT